MEHSSDKEKEKAPHKPIYRNLGESGLVVDEYGEIYDVTDICGDEEPEKPALSEPVSKDSKKSSFVSSLDDKANPAYWYHYYDERYCGCSREEYMEKMAEQYRREKKQEKEIVPSDEDKADSEYRDFCNDACDWGPSREETMEKMAEQNRGQINQEKENVPSDEDEADPEYWDFYYDARYCGPSRQGYVGRMVRQNLNRKQNHERKQANNGEILETVRRVADRNQQKAELEGIRPDYHIHLKGMNTYGLINGKGETIVEYGKYFLIGKFRNGLSRVVNDKTGKFGFINPEGQEIIPCVWKSAGEFSEYLAGVKDANNKCGYVDVSGQLTIPCTWDESWPFQDGLARVMNNGMVGLIDRRGELVVPLVWKGMGNIGEGLIGVQSPDGKCGYIDKTGNVVIPCQWKNVWAFSEGRAAVQGFNNLYGYIDKNGELVIPCQWKKVEFFKNGKARVLLKTHFFRKDEWVYIDKQGRVL